MTRRHPIQKPSAARPRAADGAALQGALIEAVRQHQAGQLDAAAAGYARILAIDPGHAEALHLSGLIAHQRGDNARAVELIGKAIRRNPRIAAYHNHLGSALLAMDRVAEATASLRRALALDPGHADAHNNLGNVMMREGRPAEAEGCYLRAIAARPGYAVGWNNLGGALRAQGRLDAAAAAYREALTCAPQYVGALGNLGRVLHEQGRYEEALAHYDRALAIDPGHAESHANRATLLLLLGRFKDGWAEYEWRWRVKGFSGPRRDFGKPLWDGSDLAGRTLLIHAEQGQGSAIQFVRYVPLVAARGGPLLATRGGRVVLECQRPLARLFQSLVAGISGALTIKGEALPSFDVQAPLMSLPHIFGTDAATIPANVPYLAADPALSRQWGERLAAWPRPRVGLVWAGNPRRENDANRSMPAAAFAPLLEKQGLEKQNIALFSLQVGTTQADKAWLSQTPIHDLAPGLTDFADTAAVLGHLDLVMSVDTAVAHLAGALGRP
ncbi:MAG: tetratricopeptide repeat protein, partial [Methyloceanibacter sp.]